MNLRKALLLSCSLAVASLSGCATSMTPIKPVPRVDLPRFMGSWYVIASIPSFLEKKACNAVETYTLEPNGHIATVFRYRNSGFTTPLKTIHSTGFVTPGSNDAVWGVQLIWPIKAQYIVAYLDPQYSHTIIARDKRDYVWIMARTPTISAADYDALVARVKAMGYNVADLRKVPQSWPESAAK